MLANLRPGFERCRYPHHFPAGRTGVARLWREGFFAIGAAQFHDVTGSLCRPINKGLAFFRPNYGSRFRSSIDSVSRRR